MNTRDPSSFSRIDLEKTEHIHLNLDVDFKNKILSGSATYKIKLSHKNDNKIVLDVGKLKIKYIKLNVSGDLRCLNFTETDLREGLGSKLSVHLPPNVDKNEVAEITINYSTSSDASGLQWLEPSQTAGLVHPYMFSQFQAIHARSAFPCQDTPAIKCTYSAHITHPLELKALMSAICTKREPKESFFEQNVPVPSYLFCIAVGDLVSRELGSNSAVWSEKEQIEACAYEFAETCDILKAAEEICGPYVWGRYDLLVLPPSFPFGGMENPCLTFVTPTLLAGDRSLVDVVAHEIAHSWTGNLVTNCNFEHFWLNEGFTVFVEDKIQGRMYGENIRDFHSLCGLTTLKEEIKHLGEANPLTALVVNLEDLSPDDAFSSIPYMKGSLFLRYLEQLLGGNCVFGCFLKEYIDHFKYKSIDTDDFKNFLMNYFKDNTKINEIDWDTWLNKPGMPPIIPRYDETILSACQQLVDFWISPCGCITNLPEHLKDLSSSQIVQFLSLMIEKCPLSIEKLKNMDAIHNLNSSGNAEIKFRWLRLCILSKWSDKIKAALEFVTSQGRMKFVRPLYRDMYEWELSRELAIENFKKHRTTMMYVSAHTVAKDLKLES